MAKEKRVFNPVPFTVIFLALMVAFIFIYAIHSLLSFHVHTNLSPETKADMACLAKCPGISAYIERYGDRGPMDIDYQIETCTFPSLAALGNSINYVEPVSEEIAKEALRLAMHKLPVKCKIASKADLEGGAGSEE